MKETKHSIEKVRISLKFLISSEIVLSSQPIMNQFMEHYLLMFNKLWLTRGSRGALAYCKELRLGFTRWLSGNPLRPHELSFTVGFTTDGLPKKLGPILNLLRKGVNPSELRMIMTILSIGRTIELEPLPVPLTSITDPAPH